jgi:NAD kinase
VARRFSALVTEIHEQSRTAGRQLWQVALNRTEFAVGDGGTLEAVARSGARLVLPVLSIEIDAAGEVWHLVEKPLTVGTDITGCVTTTRV